MGKNEVLKTKVQELEKKVEQLEKKECDHKYQRTISSSIIECEKCGKTLIWCFGLGWL